MNATSYKSLQHYNAFMEAKQATQIGSSAKTFYPTACNCSLFLKEATFSYVVKGEKYMLVDKQEYYLQQGDLLYIPANSVGFTDIPKTQQPFESFNMVLRDELLESFPAAGSGVLSLKDKAFVINQDKKLIAAFDAFFKEQSDKEVYQKLLLRLFNNSASNPFECHNAAKHSAKHHYQTLTNVLVEHLYQPLSLSQMAFKSNMSLATFKRKFKEAFGESPKTWIRNRRLQAAYFHLKTGRDGVSNVSTFVGYDNFPHFSQAFKKYFQVTPSHLLKKIEPISITPGF